MLKTLLECIDRSSDVRANIYIDAELKFVPGIAEYRQNLAELLGSRETQTLAHEQIIAKLDQSAKLFRVLVLKTTLTLPYTSVFFELDCGYWTSEKEENLRRSMENLQSTS